MKAHQANFGIRAMAHRLEVSTSGYYAWLKRPPSARAKEDAVLTARVREIHEESRGTYGAPRIHRALAREGIRVGCKRVARLMRECGLAGVCRGRRPKTTRRAPAVRPAPDLVERNFTAEAPNRLWVGDITYVPTAAGFLYLAITLDVFSRRIVGWAMKSSMEADLAVGALNMAIEQRRPENVVHHSDQGSQYTSIAFGRRCREAGVARSMGSVGDCYDNAMAESFFATLECELLDRSNFRTRAEAEGEVFWFIESWYNRRRLHSALSYLSPVDFEKLHQEGAVT